MNQNNRPTRQEIEDLIADHAKAEDIVECPNCENVLDSEEGYRIKDMYSLANKIRKLFDDKLKKGSP